MENRIAASAVLSLIAFLGCGGTPTTAKKEKKAVEPIGGQTAFFRMYRMAQSWAPDPQAYKCEAIRLEVLAAKDGKFPAWRCQFVSATRRTQRFYTYSVVEAEGIHEGVFAEAETSWSGPSGQNLPFIVQAFKIDSPAALKTALEKGKDYSRKHPDIPITFQVEKVKQFGNPVWRVIWGTSASASNFSIYVDASSGEYMQTMH